MFCPHCGLKNEDDARFCSECGRGLSIQETGHTKRIFIDDLKKAVDAEELYISAYQYYEIKQYNSMINNCVDLFNRYPVSRESKWAIENFPINWSEDSGVTFDRSITINKIRLVGGIVGALILFVGLFVPLAGTISLAQWQYPIDDWLFGNTSAHGSIYFEIFTVLSGLSLLFSITKSFEGLWLTGYFALIVSIDLFFKCGNLIEWGWLLLLFASCLLLCSAGIPKRAFKSLLGHS